MATSTVFQPIADRLAELLRGIMVDGTALNVPEDSWTRGVIHPPAAEIELPEGTKPGPEQSQSELGSFDYDLEFPVTIWVELTDVTVTQKRLAQYLEEFIAAVDNDPTLDNTVLDSSVDSFEVVYGVGDGRKRDLIGYETRVGVIKLIPQQ